MNKAQFLAKCEEFYDHDVQKGFSVEGMMLFIKSSNKKHTGHNIATYGINPIEKLGFLRSAMVISESEMRNEQSAPRPSDFLSALKASVRNNVTKSTKSKKTEG
jgi:hypothetical protein